MQVAPIGAEAVENLAGQFARRAEYQYAATLAHRRARRGGKLMQDRQREGRGLAGAGLGDADNVAARHQERDGLGLDRGWREVLFLGGGTGNGVVEFEVGKGGQMKELSGMRA